MGKRMLIAADEEESRVAIIDNMRLENLEIEAIGGEGRRGNIYKGVVHKVEQSLQAAFIDFGEEKQGFLPLGEIHRCLWPEGLKEKRPDISLLLREKQELMVQVVKDEIGTKGATLTTFVSLPGRYLVLMPESDRHGISRRLGDAERRRLKETVDSIGVPDGFGVIIRTAGEQQRPLELKKDLLYLTKLYETIEAKFAHRKTAGIIYQDRRHAVRFIRDYFADDIDEVWCDDRGVLKEISEFMRVLMPAAQEKLRLYEGQAPLFIKFGVEDQIESVFARTVQLPGGGSIVIDSTEALVAIDVNSGKVKGQDIEETALMTNLEAADEVARQVKIRDLGGLVVIDFIDMRDRKNNRQVEQRLRQAFREDKAKIKFGRISSFGLMELSRQRLRKSLFRSITRSCTACDGTGRVRAPASAALSLLRRIEEACLRGGVKYIRATTPVAIANLLLNRRRRELAEIESKLGVVVEVVAHKDMPANLVALDVVELRGGRQAPQRIYQLLDLIRNEVVRTDRSPLPRPEDGIEALELDHTAIYRAIAERDAILKDEDEAEKDIGFEPQEPDLAEDDDDDDAAQAEKGKPKRKRRRKRRRPEGEDAVLSGEGESGDLEGEEPGPDENGDLEGEEPGPDENGREDEAVDDDAVEEDVAAEDQGTGFWGWMKRKFFSRGGDRAAVVSSTPVEEPSVAEVEEPITDEIVEQAEARRVQKERPGQDRAGEHRAGQSRTGQDRSERDRQEDGRGPRRERGRWRDERGRSLVKRPEQRQLLRDALGHDGAKPGSREPDDEHDASEHDGYETEDGEGTRRVRSRRGGRRRRRQEYEESREPVSRDAGGQRHEESDRRPRRNRPPARDAAGEAAQRQSSPAAAGGGAPSGTTRPEGEPQAHERPAPAGPPETAAGVPSAAAPATAAPEPRPSPPPEPPGAGTREPRPHLPPPVPPAALRSREAPPPPPVRSGPGEVTPPPQHRDQAPPADVSRPPPRDPTQPAAPGQPAPADQPSRAEPKPGTEAG